MQLFATDQIRQLLLPNRAPAARSCGDLGRPRFLQDGEDCAPPRLRRLRHQKFAHEVGLGNAPRPRLRFKPPGYSIRQFERDCFHWRNFIQGRGLGKEETAAEVRGQWASRQRTEGGGKPPSQQLIVAGMGSDPESDHSISVHNPQHPVIVRNASRPFIAGLLELK